MPFFGIHALLLECTIHTCLKRGVFLRPFESYKGRGRLDVVLHGTATLVKGHSRACSSRSTREHMPFFGIHALLLECTIHTCLKRGGVLRPFESYKGRGRLDAVLHGTATLVKGHSRACSSRSTREHMPFFGIHALLLECTIHTCLKRGGVLRPFGS